VTTRGSNWIPATVAALCGLGLLPAISAIINPAALDQLLGTYPEWALSGAITLIGFPWAAAVSLVTIPLWWSYWSTGNRERRSSAAVFALATLPVWALAAAPYSAADAILAYYWSNQLLAYVTVLAAYAGCAYIAGYLLFSLSMAPLGKRVLGVALFLTVLLIVGLMRVPVYG
jgi:hypothetical protein